MVKNVRAELASLLGVTAQPFFSRLWRHPDSMPQYSVGHDSRINRIEAALDRFPTLALAGSTYHGVGISDCVRSGEEAAEKVVKSFFRDCV
jgi:oxygen-dependent protoporphyrinogen oxidase